MQKDYFTISIPIHKSVNQGKLLRLTKICKRDRFAKKDMFNKIIDCNGGILKKFQNKKNSKKTYSSNIDNYFYPHHDKIPKYDLQKYHPCYKREYVEIRKEIQELVHNYVTLSGGNYKNGKPFIHNLRRYGTRRMDYKRTCLIRTNESKLTRYWLEIYDYFDEDHLRLPLRCDKGLQNFFKDYGISFDQTKTVTLVEKKYEKNTWIANFTFDLNDINHERQINSSNYYISEPPKCGNQAFLSLDAGIRIPYVGIFVTPLGLHNNFIRYYKIPELQKKLHLLDLKISRLQMKLNSKLNESKQFKKLNKLNSKKEFLNKDIVNLKRTLARVRQNWYNVRKEAEEYFSNQIVDELKSWKHKGWDIKLIVGDLTGIKNERMTYIKGKDLRRRLNRWMYKKRVDILQRKCKRADIEFHAINEDFTSRTCPNCGVTEFRHVTGSKKRRNKIMRNFSIQRSNGYFKCNQCLWSGNADLVGAINIAKKFMVEYYQADEELLKQALKREYYYYQNDFYRRQLEKNPIATKPGYTTWDWIKKQKINSNSNRSKHLKKPIEVSLNKFKLKWFNRPHSVSKSLNYWVQSIRIPVVVNS